MSARFSTARMSSSLSGWRARTRERDSSGLTTEKNGFSVVAAIRLTIRSSTALSRLSCCVLENRWTSSMKSTVRRPAKVSSRFAAVMTARTSLTPESSADSWTNCRLVASEMTCASVVLPVPGGP